MTGAPEHRRHLVHDAARHAGRGLLGRLRDPRDDRGGVLEAADLARGDRDGDGERGARRQARADRHRRRHLRVEADRGADRAATSSRSTAATTRPHCGSTSRGSSVAVGRDLDDAVERVGAGDDAAVGARLGADDDLAVDGHREAEAVLVVGVVTDQVDAARARARRARPESNGAGRTGRRWPVRWWERRSGGHMGRFQNSIALAKSSWEVLRDDKQLTLLPLLSLRRPRWSSRSRCCCRSASSPRRQRQLLGLEAARVDPRLRRLRRAHLHRRVLQRRARVRREQPVPGGARRRSARRSTRRVERSHVLLPWAIVSATVSVVLARDRAARRHRRPDHRQPRRCRVVGRDVPRAAGARVRGPRPDRGGEALGRAVQAHVGREPDDERRHRPRRAVRDARRRGPARRVPARSAARSRSSGIGIVRALGRAS